MIAFDFPIFMLTAVDTKTCDRCGTPFVRSRRQGPRVWLRRRYCSQRCSSRAGAARDAQRLRDEAGCYNCLVCSKQLGGFQTKFCSNACANEHNNGGEQPPTKGRGRTYAEVAESLGLTVEQVRNAEASAFRKLSRNPQARALLRLWLAS
jgi:hypothetical protein